MINDSLKLTFLCNDSLFKTAFYFDFKPVDFDGFRNRKENIMARIFGGGEEFLTKRDFSEAVDLLQGCIPQQKTYNTNSDSSLDITTLVDRVLFFPISVTEGELIDVSFQPKASGSLWGYFFASATENHIPNTMVYMSDWLTDTFKSLVVPAKAKYFGICIYSTGVTPQNWTQNVSLSVTTEKGSVNALSRLVNDTVLTPNNLASIMGNVLVTADLASDGKWSKHTYDRTADGGLDGGVLPARVSLFPLTLPKTDTISVKLSLSDGVKWGYYFTTVPQYDVANTLVQMSDWLTDTAKDISVPANAKYFGITLFLPQDDTPENVSKYASVQLLVKMPMSEFLQRENKMFVKFN